MDKNEYLTITVFLLFVSFICGFAVKEIAIKPIPHNFTEVYYSSKLMTCGACPSCVCEVNKCTNVTKYVEVINESNNS
jgi:hypothetical protein